MLCIHIIHVNNGAIAGTDSLKDQSQSDDKSMKVLSIHVHETSYYSVQIYTKLVHRTWRSF